jgi:hypothetical protein
VATSPKAAEFLLFWPSVALAEKAVGVKNLQFGIQLHDLRRRRRRAGVRRFRLFGQLPGSNKLKAGSRLLVSPFPEIKFMLSCCGVL